MCITKMQHMLTHMQIRRSTTSHSAISPLLRANSVGHASSIGLLTLYLSVLPSLGMKNGRTKMQFGIDLTQELLVQLPQKSSLLWHVLSTLKPEPPGKK